jgi:hypothetical protein
LCHHSQLKNETESPSCGFEIGAACKSGKEGISGIDAKPELVESMTESAYADFKKTGLFLEFIWKADQRQERCQRIAADGFNAGCWKLPESLFPTSLCYATMHSVSCSKTSTIS